MRIGIDGTTLCDAQGRCGAGIEHYTWSIVYTMLRLAPQHEFVIAVPRYLPKRLEADLLEGVQNAHVFRPIGPRISVISRHMNLPLRFASKRINILFGPAGQIPMGWRGQSVVTVHDASIFEHPEWFPSEGERDFSTGVVVPYSLKQAQGIIAVSEATKQQLLRVFPYTEGKISVVHEGVTLPETISELPKEKIREFGLTEDTVLSLGTIEPRKNVATAIKAFHLFLSMHPDRARYTRFILAGKMGWKTEEVERVMQEVNDVWQSQIGSSVVRHIGFVSEEEKWALLRGASVVMFVSLEEGFGLPLIEAQAVGTPVIASNRGSLPEVGGDAALYVDPDDTENMALAIAQALLVPDGVKEMVQEGKQQVKRFTWERAATQTLEVLESAYQKNRD